MAAGAEDGSLLFLRTESAARGSRLGSTERYTAVFTTIGSVTALRRDGPIRYGRPFQNKGYMQSLVLSALFWQFSFSLVKYPSFRQLKEGKRGDVHQPLQKHVTLRILRTIEQALSEARR